MSVDIHAAWCALMGRNAGEIMSWTVDLVKQSWRLMENQPADWMDILNAYRKHAMSGDYDRLISESAEFIREQTGIQLDVSYLLRHD